MDACLLLIVLSGFQHKLGPYQKRSDNTAYHSPFPLYVILKSPPRHCRISVTSASIPPLFRHVHHVTHPCQPSHMATHHPTVLDPTNDIMLTSSIENAPNNKFFHISRKNRIFSHFSLSEHYVTCMSFYVVLCQPPEIDP